jgi:hypothetical protein
MDAVEIADRQRDMAVRRAREIPLYTQCASRRGEAGASRCGVPLPENRRF